MASLNTEQTRATEPVNLRMTNVCQEGRHEQCPLHDPYWLDVRGRGLDLCHCLCHQASGAR